MTKRFGASCGVACAPARDQVGAQQHQQHQREQADRERRDLQHGERRPRGDLARRQHQPARRARFGHRAAQQHARASHDSSANTQTAPAKPPTAIRPSFRSLDTASSSADEAERAGGEHGDRRRLQRADVAPDHAQRRHARQLQHRRQAEAEQQREADADAEQRRPDARRRQRRVDQAGEQPARRRSARRSRAATPTTLASRPTSAELDEVLQRDRALRQAEHAQHRAVVEVAARRSRARRCRPPPRPAAPPAARPG